MCKGSDRYFHAWIDQRTVLGSLIIPRKWLDTIKSYDVKCLFPCQLVTSNAVSMTLRLHVWRVALK